MVGSIAPWRGASWRNYGGQLKADPIDFTMAAHSSGKGRLACLRVVSLLSERDNGVATPW